MSLTFELYLNEPLKIITICVGQIYCSRQATILSGMHRRKANRFFQVDFINVPVPFNMDHNCHPGKAAHYPDIGYGHLGQGNFVLFWMASACYMIVVLSKPIEMVTLFFLSSSGHSRL